MLKLLCESTKFEYCSPPGVISWKLKWKSILDRTHPRPGIDFSSIPEEDPYDVGLVCSSGKVKRSLSSYGRLVRARLIKKFRMRMREDDNDGSLPGAGSGR